MNKKNAPHEDNKKLVQARDRIAQAYLGLWGSSETQERARRRIHWLAGQAKGSRVLDVGCSEGILALLLAREGFEVLGVDVNSEALAYAKDLLEKELEPVRNRVELVHGDLQNMALDGQCFDTVILEEILEHLLHPGLLLEKACTFLNSGGRLLITTPFGHFPGPDHKQTFTLSDLSSLLEPVVSPEHLDVVDGYIRFAGRKEESGQTNWSGFDNAFLLKISEQAIVDQQVFLRSHIDRWKTSENTLRKQYEENKKTLENLKAREAKIKNELNSLQAERDDLLAKLESTEQEINRLTSSLNQAEERYNQAIAANGELRKAHEQEKEKTAKLKEEYNSLQQSFNELRSQLHTERLSRNRAAWNYYRTRYNLIKAKETLSFQLGQVIIQAVFRPGKNTLKLPVRLIRLAASGIFQRKTKSNTEIFPLMFKLPGGADKFIYFTTNKPEFLNWEGDKLNFAISEGESAYLTSKENSSFSNPPGKDLFSLAPNTQYEISGVLAYEGNCSVSLWLIEYDDSKRLGEHKTTISSAPFELSFKTHQQHKKMIIAIRLTGDGYIKNIMQLWSIKQANEQKSSKKLPNKTPGHDDEKQPKLEKYKENKTSLRVINWPVELSPGKIRVMSIFDEFSKKCFQNYCTLIEPRPDNWEDLLELYKPHFALIESAWRGNQGCWQYRVASYNNPPGRELYELIAKFKTYEIPTVFWNKEDPVHFEKFIEAAKECDIILTTAAEVVEKYRQRTSARVYTLPFAAEPSLHNPIGGSERLQRVCFAGSYYANRHISRQKELTMLLEAAAQYDLDIYDRNYGTGSKDFMFPEQFQPFVRGRLPYEDMNRAYRRYRVFLNANSVVDSPTMFSRRVFELLACGTPVISTPSRGVEEIFGQDLVWIVRTSEEAKEALEVLLNDDKEWRRRSIAGIRTVMENHTYQHRFNDLLGYVGLDKQNINKQVLVIAEVWSQNEMECVLASFNRQNLSSKKLLVVARTLSIQRPDADIDFIEEPERPLETIATEAALSNGSTHVACFSGKCLYGSYYLTDLVNAISYSGADLVGKDLKCTDRYAFTSDLDKDALLVDVNALTHKGFKLDVLFNIDKRSSSIERGMRTFVPDGANFARLDINMNVNPQVLNDYFVSMEM